MLKRWLFSSLLSLFLASFLLLSPAHSASVGRGIRTKVQPVYPQIARNMRLEGTVRLELLVAPNGAVRKATVLGGNPLLATAAVQAVQQWKYEPASTETTELVEMRFSL
jgi:TonB family protein